MMAATPTSGQSDPVSNTSRGNHSGAVAYHTARVQIPRTRAQIENLIVIRSVALLIMVLVWLGDTEGQNLSLFPYSKHEFPLKRVRLLRCHGAHEFGGIV